MTIIFLYLLFERVLGYHPTVSERGSKILRWILPGGGGSDQIRIPTRREEGSAIVRHLGGLVRRRIE